MEGLMAADRCRGCGAPLSQPFLDLGPTPLANSNLRRDDLDRAERFYPLCVYFCEACFLVQLPVVQAPESIFREYVYFSSYSKTWLTHAAQFADRIADHLKLGPEALVMEVASNDGYLLRFFKDRGIPVLGIEPARNVAVAAQATGIPTVMEFFGLGLAQQLREAGRQADLIVANNVLAHVPDLDDFVAGLKMVLKPRGLLTVEFPHLLRLMAENQFDTIYHEHLSYFSLTAVRGVFDRHGLRVIDVEEPPTHGGSLRLHVGHREEARNPGQRVEAILAAEQAAGLNGRERYEHFAEQVRETKRGLLDFLVSVKRKGQSVVGYGAPAKGNTLLNYCGVRRDFLDYTVDCSPHKQGLFLPGTRIPIHAPGRILETKPDYVLILPWNLRTEITEQMSGIREWGGRFVVPVPIVEVF
jgi:SAM-dependent methyltransferase